MPTITNPPCVIVHVAVRPDGLYDVTVSMPDGDEVLHGLSQEVKDNLLRAIDNLANQQSI